MSRRPTRSFPRLRFAVAICVSVSLLTTACAQPLASAGVSVEEDWLSPASISRLTDGGVPKITPEGDAIGGCDGIINGQYGFHTDQEDSPWWQVDLQDIQALSRIVIYNRCDWPDRPSRLIVLLSDGGSNWRQAYQHNGTGFLGYTDRQPLVVALGGAKARFVRIQLPNREYLHLDEVEVYSNDRPDRNIALNKPATQSSVSPWSVSRTLKRDYPILQVTARGRKLARDLKAKGVNVDSALSEFSEVERAVGLAAGDSDALKSLYVRARKTVRGLVFSNPLLNFDKLVFVKRAPGAYSHMSDQNYGWWSRPGGGLYILEGIKSGQPRLRCLTASLPAGSANCPDLSYDGKSILFAYCRYYPQVAGMNKYDKSKLPEDCFYHIYRVNVDGSGLKRLTSGRYDDMFPKHLPNGDIAFLSTRRGQFVQCNQASASSTLTADLPDSYVRCGGGDLRPVAIYTLHTMSPDAKRMRAISAFESFEWTPMVDEDGKITYARWDYVDRFNGPYMKLWSTRPDGTNPRIVWGNYTTNPHCIFDARRIPGTEKYMAIASPHHSITGGSVIILDPAKAMDGLDAITRLTPEVCFPETEGWPSTYYTNPYPLSENYYLVSWSDRKLIGEGGSNPVNAMGIYLADSFGNLELIYRDPEISSIFAIPLRPTKPQPAIASDVDWNGPQQGTLLLTDVYRGLGNIARGTIKRLRVIAMPAKAQPYMNSPSLGFTTEDPGKCVLGTVPVESDGSAKFTLPSGVSVFFQALDDKGRAIQTMRSLTYVQPGDKQSCIGCHESRTTAAASTRSVPIAFSRPASKLKPGPEGTWPLRYDKLVQPVLDKNCVSCHSPAGHNQHARAIDLTPEKSWDTLVNYGSPSLQDTVRAAYNRGSSIPGETPSMLSPLLAMLNQGHHDAQLNTCDMERLITWMDIYGQRAGHFSPEQERNLEDLKRQWASLLAK